LKWKNKFHFLCNVARKMYIFFSWNVTTISRVHWNSQRSMVAVRSSCVAKPETTTFYALNHYLLIAKYHVFLARNRSETPNLKVFLALLDSKIKCERQIAIKNYNYEKYRAKWTTLSNYDAWSTLSVKIWVMESFIIFCMCGRGVCVCVCCVSFALYVV